jgi:hypothetical protein
MQESADYLKYVFAKKVAFKFFFNSGNYYFFSISSTFFDSFLKNSLSECLFFCQKQHSVEKSINAVSNFDCPSVCLCLYVYGSLFFCVPTF